ncbi:MAG: SOS response-associated peptidase [Deltaproteobacteria bacterium]|nr:SOS response-associated peptidase [Deltaproteobacteria bacterium]
MCGRFVLFSNVTVISRELNIHQVPFDFAASYNIAPGQDVVAVINRGAGNELVTFRWGLIPFWSKDPKIGNRMINARGETVTEKASFRTPFKKRRCLIVADGFYEWRKEGKGKVPVYVFLKSRRPFGLAGLFDSWNSPAGEEISTCTIITTEANELLRQVHDRMPVIIPQESRGLWLDTASGDAKSLTKLLVPYPSDLMDHHDVSRFVNSPKNNSPVCIQPAAE